MPRARTSYGPGGVESVFDLGPGVDIGAKPDFWADVEQVMRRLKPTKVGGESAMSQGRALRAGSAPAMPAMRQTPTESRAPKKPLYHYEPTFATVIGRGPQSAGIGYQNWTPGMNFAPTNKPFATGYKRILVGYE